MKIAILMGHGIDKEGAVDGKFDDEIYEDKIYTRESVYVRNVGLKLAAKLIDQHEILLVRPNDKYVTLKERVRQANNWGADILISLHTNASVNNRAEGIETIYYPTSTNGKRLALDVQNRLIQRSKAVDRGIKPRSNLFVLRASSMPSILIELGFITNPYEEERMHNRHYKNKLIQGIIEGVNDYEQRL